MIPAPAVTKRDSGIPIKSLVFSPTGHIVNIKTYFSVLTHQTTEGDHAGKCRKVDEHCCTKTLQIQSILYVGQVVRVAKLYVIYQAPEKSTSPLQGVSLALHL